MLNTILTETFTEELSNFGFPSDMKINYSLNYDQNDGVSFEGTLEKDNLLRMVPLFEEYREDISKQEKIINLIKKIDWADDKNNYEDLCFFGRDQIKKHYADTYESGQYFDLHEYQGVAANYQDWNNPTEILIENIGRNYHCCSMELGYDKSDRVWYFDESMKDRWFFSPESLQEYKDIWDEFIQLLYKYVQFVSSCLERIGYKIIESYEEFEEGIA